MKMSGSTRAESASSSLDGSNFVASYNNGQRAYSGSIMERSGSFRESLENRILVTGPSASRNAASSEVSPLSHYLSLESFAMSDQRYSRSGELRRVLGVTVEEHSFGSSQSKPLPPIASEDLKRFKSSIFESSSRARERVKSFQELILKLDKYRNLVSRKRQRTDQSNEKSGNLNPLKMGSQSHQSPGELASPRLDDRAKNVIPNKRMRSSMADVRSEGRGTAPPRQGAVLDKDKSVLFDKDRSLSRGCNGGPIPSDDKMCGLPPGGDGWEKNKRKRSVGLSRVIDGDREIKQSIQQKSKNESRLRSSDGIGFRPGFSSGTTPSNKLDSSSELNGPNARGTPKNDLDSSSMVNERREHSVGLDNERTGPKGSNKLNIREEVQMGNQSSLLKGKASRAPRTGSSIVMNASSNFLRSSGSNDGWDQASCINKIQPSNGMNNRKGSVYSDSPSPPVTQWVGQRPQKISRTRRVNVVSPVSNLDEAQFSHEGFATPDVGVRMATTDTSGLLVSRGITNSTHQSKLKHDNVLSPSVLSESEESAAVEKKGIDNFEPDDGAQASVKATTSVLPTKKNKTPPKEEIGDGVRRQGRSGRGSVHPKACLPIPKEKLENVDSAKPVKNGKHGSERTESRIGRPPSKKMSDRKASARTQIINGGSLELTGESEDDQEELLAAANAARNASYNGCSGNFWKKMEPIFAFVTLEDVSFVKNQIHFAKELDSSLSSTVEAHTDIMGEVICDMASSPRFSFAREQTNTVGQSNKSVETLYSADGTQHAKTSVGKLETKRWYDKMVPLSQRLLSAFITEDEIEKLENDTNGESILQFSSDYVHANDRAQNLGNINCQLELDYKNQKNSVGYDGFMASNNFRHSNTQNFVPCDGPMAENNAILNTYNGSLSDYQKNNLNHLQIMDNTFPYECRYEDMPLDDRILMELRSIGLHLDTVPDLAETESEDGEIDKAISELNLRLHHQVRKKKNQLENLEKAVQDVKDIEERKLEQLAVNKLIETAYKKLMGGRGSHKSGLTKVSKQHALAFAKRTIARCHKFEETGRSCFSEPALRDVILSVPQHHVDAKHVDGSGITGYAESRNGQVGLRVSGGTTIMDRHGLGNKMDRGPLETYQSSPQMGEQSVIKSDRKKKEILLDDVAGAASRTISTPTHTIPSSAKWKRTERERDQNKDALGRSSTAKAGRPSLSNSRGERKTKTKPKQKIAQLSTSGNGIGRVTETANFMSPASQESFDTVNNSVTKTDQEVELQSSSNVTHDSSKEIDDAIFTNLPLNGIDSIDELDVGLGGQGQDIASWLNVDEDALQDHDLVGLEIPMDDLSELKLNF
ncbi:hypothetical protein Cni_G06033 [Canna indica]|uniref:Uncharacterized protein n=1 Tax=Canna indica TaxID=4628 RepID=A0AAQ3K0K7_9LILI|nr:hypothetical protein Cni_G06033 [Canna indica]